MNRNKEIWIREREEKVKEKTTIGRKTEHFKTDFCPQWKQLLSKRM